MILCRELHHETEEEEEDDGWRSLVMLTHNLVVGFLEPFKPLSSEIQPVSSLWVEGKLDHTCAWVHSFMGTKVANLETQDALLFHRVSAALDFCSHLWICCHFGFGVGDDALFLRIVGRVVVYCWFENLNGYYCYHVLFLFFVFLQVLWNLLCLLDRLFSGRWEIRSWEFSQPVDPSAISADVFSLTLFEETTSQMLSCNAHEIDGFSLWVCRSLACDDFKLIL